jgi:hypothetical protein
MAVNDDEVLRPAEFARRLGVRTIVVLRAMHAQQVPRVELPDGTLGIPESALASFSTE